jgi:hypothetical protein
MIETYFKMNTYHCPVRVYPVANTRANQMLFKFRLTSVEVLVLNLMYLWRVSFFHLRLLLLRSHELLASIVSRRQDSVLNLFNF